MSTVSGINSSSALSWLKNIRATSSTSSTSSTQQPGGDFQSKVDTALSDQGITGTKLTDLRSQIQAAVEKAKSSSEGSADDRAAVKSAVDGVLKSAGVDVDKFDAEIKPKGGKGGPHGAHGKHGPPPGPPPSDASSTDGSTSTSSTSNTSDSSFDAYLKSSGIDPDTFKSSILATLQNGGTDFSSAFNGASVGSSVDLVA